MASATESLRWVKYEDVYYAALLVPADDAPMPVEPGHVFVYFLGSESGAVVPVGDTSPYDPTDTERTSNPAAEAGVRVAQQIIMGAAAAEQEQEEDKRERAAKERESPSKKKKKEKKRKHKTKERHGMRDEEEEDEMVLGTMISINGKHRGERDYDDEEEEDAVLRLRPSAERKHTKKKKNKNNKYDGSEEGEDEDSVTSNGDVSSEEREQRDRWNDMAEDLNIATPSGVSGRRTHKTNINNNRRYVDTNVLPIDGGSIVMPFLAEIRHYYRAALTEAVESDRIVNLQESDLVHIVESHLLKWRGEVSYLQSVLQDVEQEYQAAIGAMGSEAKNDIQLLEEEAESLRNRLNALNSSLSIEAIVQKHLHLRDRPLERRDRKRVGVSSTGGKSAFMDASRAFVLDTKSSAAAPREVTQQLMQRYVEQRRRERLLTSQNGLGKLGFIAPVARVMENWRQSRELMVLDPLRESQPVSRRYSECLAKVERHALKCFSAAAGNNNDKNNIATTNPLLSAFLSQKKKYQQHEQTQRTSRNIYNFHDFQQVSRQTSSMNQAGSSSSGGGNPFLHFDGDDTAAGSGHETFEAPLVSPLRTSFDPRATFAVDVADIVQDNRLAEQLAMQSMQYSQSIFLPSQESVWANSELYEGGRRKRSGRSTSRAGSMSRASSRASSVAHDDMYSKSNNNNNSVKHSGERRSQNDWRASAKRAILEQLTLYLRGLRGKPAVINKDQFQLIAKKLLERAVLSESERTGVSMCLQANNANTPFTKEIDGRLRKSVDNYMARHFGSRAASEARKRSRGGDTRASSVEAMTASALNNTTHRPEDEDDDDGGRSVMGAYPHSNNSPVYDEWR